MKNRKWIALLLAGGKGTRLAQLTTTIVKPALPFGGKYRIIDFALSNCKNSGIDTVGVLTQYRPLALHAHLANYKLSRSGSLTILPPYQRNENGIQWFEGTSHAVYQHIEFIDECNPDDVLILSTDQVYKMDYSLMLEQHKETNADCTIAAVEVPWEEASRFGLIRMDTTNKIKEFEEKPLNPSTNFASMGIYIFKWSVLKEYLINDEKNEYSRKDFAKDIIPLMLEDGLQLYAYKFNKYWRDVGTIYSYWQANLDLLNKDRNLFLQHPEWEIYTAEKNETPVYISETAKVSNSFFSDGCELSGSIEHSVLFTKVKVGKGASIKKSVILPGTIIEENAWVENVVIGSHSLIKNGVIIVSRNPDQYLMVVGNHKTIDPLFEDTSQSNQVITVIS
nr:glucose-1-phosphate adenylyltransferase [Neobacillus sp. Marseille-Q6967]